MGGRERRTQRKPIKCGHKKDTALQVLLWHGTAARQAGGFRQDVGFLGNNKVWYPLGVFINGLHDRNVQDGLNS